MKREHTDPREIIPCDAPSHKRFKDVSGQKFGRLTVVRFYGIRHNTSGSVYFWECLCDCGVTRVICKGNLTSGSTKSCGCLGWECQTRLGLSQTPEYYAWHHMWKRCTNPIHKEWHY